MERKFRPTLSTKPTQNLSTVTFFNSPKHVLRTPSHAFSASSAFFWHVFELIALIWISRKNSYYKSVNLPKFREKSKTSKRKKKTPLLPEEPFPSPPVTSSLKDVLHDPRVDLFLPEEIFPGPSATSSLKDVLLHPQVIYLETGFCAYWEFPETGLSVLRIVNVSV
jgi:hypothetical protein